jgi:hypothetical protein
MTEHARGYAAAAGSAASGTTRNRGREVNALELNLRVPPELVAPADVRRSSPRQA